MKKEINGIIRKAGKELKSGKYWSIFRIDILFILAIVVMSIATYKIPGLLGRNTSILLLFLVGHVLWTTALYSAFKYWALKVILGKKIKEGFLQFWIINLLLFLAVGTILLVMYMAVKYFILPEHVKAYFGVLLLVVLVITYVMGNIIQALKFEKKDIEDSLAIIKRNFRKYSYLLLIEAVSIGIIYALLLIKGNIWIYITVRLLSIIMILAYNAFNKIFFAESLSK